MSTIIPEKNI